MPWPIFDGIDPDAMARLDRLMTSRSYRAGDYLCRQGEPGNTVWVVEEGRVVIESVTAAGDVVGFELIGPGNVLGELALLSPDQKRTATARALDDVRVTALDGRSFAELREAHPTIDRFLVTLLERRVRRLSDHLSDALYATAEVRILRRLRDLAWAYGDVLKLTQQELAGLAGTTRPTVNRVLRQLEDRGVISLGRSRVTVLDAAELIRLADEDSS